MAPMMTKYIYYFNGHQVMVCMVWPASGDRRRQ
jgi:hypothetical protein